MNLRQHKRRHDARTWRRLHTWRDRGCYYFDSRYTSDDWDDDEDLGCTHCGGEGYAEVDDPLWDDCDEFGWGPCSSCRGTGQRRHQWVF